MSDSEARQRSAPGAGPRIAVIAPSGAHLSVPAFEAALERLRAMGCELRDEVPAQPWLRFAGTDEARLAQIERAARMTDIDAVMIVRGGYGLSRLLDRIDWPLVAASVARGVRWIGYSDFTAFQLALLAQTGARSFAGPALAGDFGAARPDAFMLAQFEALLAGHSPDVEWAAEHDDGRLPAGESVQGVVWGGNLSLVAALVGTPYLPEVDGGLLFVEDVAEHPYRVERMLHQLLFAGVLARQRALILGGFTAWKAASHDNGFDLRTVIDYFRARLPQLPIVCGLPFGHLPGKAILELGRRYRLQRVNDAGWCLRPLGEDGSDGSDGNAGGSGSASSGGH
ncbi:MAG: LD-carboxypeptidase [Burkholderiaceae bacterium]